MAATNETCNGGEHVLGIDDPLIRKLEISEAESGSTFC